MKFSIFLLGFIFLLGACKTESQEVPFSDQSTETSKKTIVDNKANSNNEKPVFSVNEFKRGTSINQNNTINGVKCIRSSNKSTKSNPYDYYYHPQGNKDVRIFPAKDPRTGTYANIVGEISIRSQEYSDDKGIHVGSTVADFMNTYKNAYSYFDLANESIILSDEGQGPQYVVSSSDLIMDDEIRIGRIKNNQVKKNAIIKEIRIVRSKQENQDAKIAKNMEEQIIIEEYFESLLGKYYLNNESENYYKVHKLQGDYYISECFEDDCRQKGKINSALNNKMGFTSLKVEGMSGESVPSWSIKPVGNKTELHAYGYDAEEDSWSTRVFTKP